MFKASAAQVDLAPLVGSWMTGFAARVLPATGIHDPIMARAVLLDDGRTRLAIVSCDVIGFTSAAVADMRHRIARKTSIPAVNILISCTHTHSGPATMPFRGVMGHVDADWLADAQHKIVDLVASLPAALKPAQFAHGSTHVSGIGYNRQDQSHAVDEELTAIAVDAADGTAIATLVNYGTHPVVLGARNLLFSADFPGDMVQVLSAERGGVVLYLQGTCGDIDPIVHRDRGWGTGTFDDTREIGNCLATAAVNALKDAPRTGDVALRITSKLLEVPLDAPPAPEALAALAGSFEANRQNAAAEANVVEEQIAVAMLEWSQELEHAVAGGTVQRTLPCELFVAAINDLRIIGVPFETYTDIGLAVKRDLLPRKAILAGYSNGLYGYCPTGWAKEQGGYGPDTSARWFPRLLTPVGYGADELIVRESTVLGK